MKFIIFFFAVLAVSCAQDAGAGNKTCINTEKYEMYQDKKSCLKTYMGSVITSSLAPTRRKRDEPPPPAPVTTVNTTTSTTTSKPVESPPVKSPPVESPPVESPPVKSPPAESPAPMPAPRKICSSIVEVKEFFDEKWKLHMEKSKNVSDYSKIGHEIRNVILEKFLQVKRLKEFKHNDFACIQRKDIKNHLKENCVLDILQTSAKRAKIPLRISNVISKYSTIRIEKATCMSSVTVSSCVKDVLTNCSSTVQKFVGDLDKMMSERCEPHLRMGSPEPVKSGMSTIVIVVIVLVAICGSLAAGYGLFKFLKMRRNRGLHTVSRNQPEECEMTSRIRSQNKE